MIFSANGGIKSNEITIKTLMIFITLKILIIYLQQFMKISLKITSENYTQHHF